MKPAAETLGTKRGKHPVDDLRTLAKSIIEYQFSGCVTTQDREKAVTAFEQTERFEALFKSLSSAQRMDIIRKKKIPEMLEIAEQKANAIGAIILCDGQIDREKIASSIECAPSADKMVHVTEIGCKDASKKLESILKFREITLAAFRELANSPSLNDSETRTLGTHTRNISLAMANQVKAASACYIWSALALEYLGTKGIATLGNIAFSIMNVLNRETWQKDRKVLALHWDSRALVAPEEKVYLDSRIETIRNTNEAAILDSLKIEINDQPALSAILKTLANSVQKLIAAYEDARSVPRLPMRLVSIIRENGLTYNEQLPIDRPEVVARIKQLAEAEAAAQADAKREKDSTQLTRTSAPKSGGSSSKRKPSKLKKRVVNPTTSIASAQPELKSFGEIRLHDFPAVPALTEYPQLDLVSMGATLKRDTSALRAVDQPGADPLMVSYQMRQAVNSWFGGLALWESAYLQMKDDSERNSMLKEQASARIKSIAELHSRIAAYENDSLKCTRTPKSVHLSQLLAANEVMSVSALKVLPSESDPAEGGSGTLFEAQVELAPLSDGSKASPVFLHLHTSEPMDAAACIKQPAERFVAVHIKSAEQRGLGAKWEAMQREMGTDEKVHRSPVGKQLLAQLFERMP